MTRSVQHGIAALLGIALSAAVVGGRAAHAGPPGLAQAPPEPLAIVVNVTNPVNDVSPAELRRLMLGQRGRWPNGRRVTIVMRAPGVPERSTLLRDVCAMTESGFRRHFLQAVFTGEAADQPRELSTANGVLRFVFNAPGAIGYVRAGDVDNTVKVLRVGGRSPGDPDYPLRVREPDGGPRE